MRIYAYGKGVPTHSEGVDALCNADLHAIDADEYPNAVDRSFYIVRW